MKVFISYKTLALYSFVADEDLRGQNVLQLTSLLREVLKYLERKYVYILKDEHSRRRTSAHLLNSGSNNG